MQTILVWFCFLCIFETTNALALRKQFPSASDQLYQGIIKPGPNLSLRPSSAVYQLDDNASPIKMLPATEPGTWRYPASASGEPRDMGVPVSHYFLNGEFDSSREGSNLIPKTTVTVEGVDYMKKVPPPQPPAPSQPEIPMGGGLQKQKVYRTIDITTVPSSLTPANIPTVDAAFSVPNPTFGSVTPNIPQVETPPLPGFPKFAPTTSKNLNSPSVILPRTNPSPLNFPNLNMKSSGFDLSALTNMFNMGFSGLGINFPQMGIWTPTFPSFALSLSLPSLNGFSASLPKFGAKNQEAEEKDKERILKDPVCIRDYASPCPLGWTYKEKQCTAPTSYEGSCPRVMNFLNMSRQSLSEWAVECKASWPCLKDSCPNDGKRDYSQMCPIDWSISKSNGCSPPSMYTGPCKDPSYFLLKYDIPQKEGFSRTCQAQWPCTNASCKQDFSQQCPVFYTFDQKRGVCVAEKSVTWSSCKETPTGVNNWEAKSKKEWSLQCGAPWPCASKKDKNRWCDNPDYTDPCPSGWENLQGSGLCQISLFFVPPPDCAAKGKTFSFDRWTKTEKEHFSSVCNVEWPCIGGKSAPRPGDCPIGFHYISNKSDEKNETLCESDQKDKAGPCFQTRNFQALSLVELKTLSEICDFTWPTTPQKYLKAPNFVSGSDVGSAATLSIE